MKDAVIATYELAGEFPLEDCARVVAMEQSTGTWTPLAERRASIEDRVSAWVVDTDSAAGLARIAFPLEIFETANVPGVLSVIAGNLFGLGSLRQARLTDVEFPAAFSRAYPGPAFGIAGIRKAVGTASSGRPHGGTIVKPKVGLDPKQTAAVAKEAALGGLDLIKDDETLTDQAFCPLDERARLVLEALDQAKSQTGKACLYAVNVTAGADTIAERWDRIKPYGPNCAMVDVLTAGYDALMALRRTCNVPIHVHRAMHGAMTRSADFGIDMRVIGRLVRLCGGDQLHIGSATGKMDHPRDLADLVGALKGPWTNHKAVFPVSSGGLHPALVPAEVAAFGSDVVLQAGGGIHGHPDGTRAGAKALMQAIEAVHAGRPLDKEREPELQAALRRWKDESYGYGT
ncbi:MAG: RuBisCO large subunit C-terminal-like domain-containing protein [bacterium]